MVLGITLYSNLLLTSFEVHQDETTIMRPTPFLMGFQGVGVKSVCTHENLEVLYEAFLFGRDIEFSHRLVPVASVQELSEGSLAHTHDSKSFFGQDSFQSLHEDPPEFWMVVQHSRNESSIRGIRTHPPLRPVGLDVVRDYLNHCRIGDRERRPGVSFSKVDEATFAVVPYLIQS